MGSMQDDLASGVEKTFEAASKHRDVIEKVRYNTRENPLWLALTIIHRLPDHLDAARVAGLEAWGVDLDDKDQIRKFRPRSIVEAQFFMWWADRQQIYRACLVLIDEQSTKLEGAALADVICSAFLEAAEAHLFTVVENFARLRSALPKQAFPQEELAKTLAGIVATRTSIQINSQLRTILDEAREHSPDKSARRERFEQLLIELPAEALEAWDANPPARSLSAIRTRAVHQLEARTKRNTSKTDALELATFTESEKAANRKRAAKLADEAGLPIRERQVFLFLTENPNATSTEVGQRFGVTPSTARTIKSNLKKAFNF